ncbi:hypothetical protein BpHYR1_006151 [Brachionus plicatilis]|uniref:Uncharacterized protein n=1 Tax=Brachionus plicatilis TaxID=10195 RepID=A0A3M7RAS0_BRAPC|nr:hypothetical protein BpHYR1_006151 [Brachionus plicatilis]
MISRNFKNIILSTLLIHEEHQFTFSQTLELLYCLLTRLETRRQLKTLVAIQLDIKSFVKRRSTRCTFDLEFTLIIEGGMTDYSEECSSLQFPFSASMVYLEQLKIYFETLKEINNY